MSNVSSNTINDLAVSNLVVQRNITARGNVVANQVISNSTHSPTVETNLLTVVNPITQLVVNGIQPSGDFNYKSTTTLADWTVNPLCPLDMGSSTIAGNRIGQICCLSFYLNFTDTFDTHHSVFTSTPPDFDPNYYFVSIVPSNHGDTQSVVRFTMTEGQVYILDVIAEVVDPSSVIVGTLVYFKTS